MIDLSTEYLGLKLKSPLVASAGPLTESLTSIKRLEDHGAAAVVLPSLFEEQLTLEAEALNRDLSRGADGFAESLTYLPDLHNYNLGPDGYLELIHKAKASVHIPVIASLNGVTEGGWLRYAHLMEQAGADALELNIYAIAADPDRSSLEVERDYCNLVRHVKESVHIPVAVKLSSSFTAMANMAKQFDLAGADGLVLFNRFYQPDFDIETLDVVPDLSLSRPSELLLRLHWIAIIFGRVRADLAITGGIHTTHDVLKSVMAGASVAMMTSALLRNGIEHLDTLRAGLLEWMEEHAYDSIAQMRGSMSQSAVGDPAAFERASYMRVLSSYSLRSGVVP